MKPAPTVFDRPLRFEAGTLGVIKHINGGPHARPPGPNRRGLRPGLRLLVSRSRAPLNPPLAKEGRKSGCSVACEALIARLAAASSRALVDADTDK
jgi:hypothetical protein